MLFLWLNLRNENCFWKLFLLLVYSFLLLHISAWGIPRLRTEWQQSSDCRQLCFCLLCMDCTSTVRGSFNFTDAALRTTGENNGGAFGYAQDDTGGGGIFDYGVFRLRSSWLIKNIKHKKIRNKFPLWCWHAAQDDTGKERVAMSGTQVESNGSQLFNLHMVIFWVMLS